MKTKTESPTAPTKTELHDMAGKIIDRASTESDLYAIRSALHRLQSDFDVDQVFRGKTIFLRDPVTKVHSPGSLCQVRLLPFVVSGLDHEPTSFEVFPCGGQSAEVIGIRSFNLRGEIEITRLGLAAASGIAEPSPFDWTEFSLNMSLDEKLALADGHPEKLAERYFPIRAEWAISNIAPFVATFVPRKPDAVCKGALVLRFPVRNDEAARMAWESGGLEPHLNANVEH